jgi:hypothetical protein
MKIFKVPIVHLFLLSVAAFVLAFLYNLGAEDKLSFIFTTETSLLLFTLAIIGMSFMFFGYGTPIAMAFAGLYSGLIFTVDPLLWIASVAISVFVGYMSIRLGVALLHDLQGKETFRESWKPLSILVSVIIIFALFLDLLM